MTLQEQGGDVVLTATGSLNVNALTKTSDFSACYGVLDSAGPSAPFVTIGPPITTLIDCDGYSGAISGPASFGTGGLFQATSGGTTEAGLYINASQVITPDGYISGEPISGSSTFAGQTLASLGVDPGIYTWTWGSGVDEDSIVLRIGAQPDSATPIPTLSQWGQWLLGLGVLGLAAWYWRRQRTEV